MQLLALTNSEILSVSLKLAQPQLSKKAKIDSTVALRHLKKLGMVSKMTEDLPQILIQITGAIVELYNVGSVACIVAFSITTSAFMLCFKMIANILV
jgi:hypothetical protein